MKPVQQIAPKSTAARQCRPARILCISGLDPSGGAGLQADIETVAALGGHVLGIISALTVQDSRNVQRVQAVDAALLAEQLQLLLADCRPDAVKLGLIAEAAQLAAIVEAIANLGVPVVCDPVLRAGGGAALVDEAYLSALRSRLLPVVTVLTPNAAEARRLVPTARTLDDCAAALLADGCSSVLITGGDEPGETVVDTLYRPGLPPQRYPSARLPETFHGAGCTLAAAIAAQLGQGEAPGSAIETARSWTYAALQHAFAVGGGRRIPGRLLR
jgi:hydroxymethylpyrimidine/phosphomethylpyrimidine kinase